MTPVPPASAFFAMSFLSAGYDVLILLNDALDVFDMSLDVIFTHRVNFQQHGIV